jgi:hypothetical protein
MSIPTNQLAPLKPMAWNRFHRIPRLWAALVLALVIALCVLGNIRETGMTHVQGATSKAMKSNGLVGDHALYYEISERLKKGEPYYQAAAAEQRENGYPTKPFMTMRWPTHAYLLAFFGEKLLIYLGLAIGAISIFLWRNRLAKDRDLPCYARLAAFIMIPNIIMLMAFRQWIYLHETLCAVLICLALALYRPDRQWPALLIMACAMAIREFAVPVAMIFGIAALWDRNWRAAGGWLLLGLVYLGLMALHIHQVSLVSLPTDRVSPGWTSSAGWVAYTSFVHNLSIFRYLDGWVTALLVPLSLLGWAAWKSRLGTIGFLVQILFVILLAGLARANNFYWAIMVIPTLFIGLIFVPSALYQLYQSLRYGRKGPPQRQIG